MTEFWKSNAKHYCKLCKVWMQGDKFTIRHHEQGKRHQEVVLTLKKEKQEAKRGAAINERELHKQLQEIERLANAAVDKDIASGAVRYSSAATAKYAASRHGGSFRRPPPPPPSSGFGGRGGDGAGEHGKEDEWDCPACGAHNFRGRAVCFRCQAPRPPSHGGQEGGEEDDDDGGVYTVGGVTYLDGKVHESKLKRNAKAQVWIDEREDWLECLIVAVEDKHVAHTQGLVLRTFAASFYTPEQRARAAEAAASAASADTAATAAGSSERVSAVLEKEGGGAPAGGDPSVVDESKSKSKSSSRRDPSSVLEERHAAMRREANANDVGPTVRRGLTSDKFRLVALDAEGKWEAPKKVELEAATTRLLRPPTPPPDENTGFGGWQTLSVTEVDDDDEEEEDEDGGRGDDDDDAGEDGGGGGGGGGGGCNKGRDSNEISSLAKIKEEEKKKKKEKKKRAKEEQKAREAEEEAAKAERYREMVERCEADGDDAMSSYDPWNKGVYRGVNIGTREERDDPSALPQPVGGATFQRPQGTLLPSSHASHFAPLPAPVAPPPPCSNHSGPASYGAGGGGDAGGWTTVDDSQVSSSLGHDSLAAPPAQATADAGLGSLKMSSNGTAAASVSFKKRAMGVGGGARKKKQFRRKPADEDGD